MNKKNNGFTLLEVMVSVSIIVILSTVSFGVYRVFQTRTYLSATTNTIVGALRRAQFLASANRGDSSWGVAINNHQLTIFKGTSFSGRDTVFDENTNLASQVEITGQTEIVFAKFSGEPLTTGIINLINSDGQKQIIINSKNFSY